MSRRLWVTMAAAAAGALAAPSGASAQEVPCEQRPKACVEEVVTYVQSLPDWAYDFYVRNCEALYVGADCDGNAASSTAAADSSTELKCDKPVAECAEDLIVWATDCLFTCERDSSAGIPPDVVDEVLRGTCERLIAANCDDDSA